MGGICQHHLLKAIESRLLSKAGPQKSGAKRGRLFPFKNTVGPVTADVFTVLTSQPKPSGSDPEPSLSESHGSVSATRGRGKMVEVSR